eukprot:TRINITY_DN18572_c0_g1_i1.p1 TRINITY_DN18572_c0_g1~~TRINITY_DN18572_c0_g1_i1.p1  ORF type:complete len:1040 (-),score=190.68 TRINITY_DN18572_c0_g1_i1:19-3138(-)
MFGHQGGEVGVIRAVVRRLFQYVESKHEQGWNCVCTASFCEIYNENARDLLCEGESAALPVRESPDADAFYLDGLSEMPVYNEDDCMRTLQRGAQAKILGCSHLNDVSSRSHTIFRLSLAIETPAGEMSVSELNLVDLAGAESLSYEFGHAQQTETKTINLSLLMLKSVISALANKDAFVPYRRSLLTKLLQNSLGGNSLTAMICCVSPIEDNEGMTKRTLGFGQIARQVTNKLVRNIYGADGRRLLKMRDEVEEIEINARAGLSKSGKRKGARKTQVSEEQGMEDIRVPLSGDGTGIDDDSRFVNCHVLGPDNGQLALVLHGFGKTSSGLDWQYILEPLARLGYRVVAPDMPGFAASNGSRQSSRTEKFNEPGEVTSTLLAILAYFQVTNSKGQLRKGEPAAIALGYDWGAAMALNLAAHKPRALSRVVAFHPSWTADLALLNQVKTKALLLWVPVEQLHPIAMGKRMSRALPNASLVKVDCGNFTKDKPKGTYDCIAPTVIDVISKWLSPALQSPSRTPANDEEEVVDPELRRRQRRSHLQSMLKDPAARGLASGSRAHVDKDKLKAEARQAIYTASATPPPSANTAGALVQWAVTRFRELCFSGEINDYFKAYQTNTPLKPTVVRLFSALPTITPGTTIQDMHTWGVWPTLPRGHELLDNFPRYLPGRQVLVVAPVHGEIDAGRDVGHENYGCFKSGAGNSRKQVTHRASIVRHNMDDDGKLVYTVAIDNPAPQGGASEFKVSAKDMYHLNEPTNFAGDPIKDGLLFEDGVRCKYGDLLTKAKVMQAALAVAPCVAQMDFEHSFEQGSEGDAGREGAGRLFGQGPGAEALLQCQKRIITRIRRTFDCIHFDYEPMEAARSSRPEVGQLALYGQGNCHTMASVMAALLLPFANVGIQVRYRAGFVSKAGRDLGKDNLEPLESWDRRPRPIDDHTWLEVTMLPSLQSFVCDPSSHELCVPLDHAYSRWGRRHPSTALQCGSLKLSAPPVAVLPASRDEIWRVSEVERLYWPARTSCRQEKPHQVKWSQIASEFAQLGK